MLSEPAPARWPARLELHAVHDGAATRLRARHLGPLRLLKTLYPEGPGIAHAVIVHPPGGLVGGDRLAIALDVRSGAHLLVTTPAATRFYRSIAGEAVQAVDAHVHDGGRLEWLPQETLAYDGCDARNEVRLHLAAGASVLASEVLALGLPATGLRWAQGRLLQHLEIDGLWRDRGWLNAEDAALLDGPCGLGGHRVLGSLVFATTGAQPDAEALVEASRHLLDGVALPVGITRLARPKGTVLLLRVLGHEVEQVTQVLRHLRGFWRRELWELADVAPRIWAT